MREQEVCWRPRETNAFAPEEPDAPHTRCFTTNTRPHLGCWQVEFSSLLLFSHSVMSDSSKPCGLQHARLPCLSPSPRACSNSVSIESVMPSSHLVLCHPFLLLPSIFPRIRAFSNESALRISWPKYWSFSFSIGPSSEYSGLTY